MRLIEALGLNWKILLAQLINFAVLVWVLNKFGYKPMIKFIEERRKKISDGLKNAKLAEKRLEEADQKEKEIVTNAKKEAQKIIQNSGEVAKKNEVEIIQKAEEEAHKILESSQKKAEQEKTKILDEAKSELAELVVMATEKMVKKNSGADEDKLMAQKFINEGIKQS